MRLRFIHCQFLSYPFSLRRNVTPENFDMNKKGKILEKKLSKIYNVRQYIHDGLIFAENCQTANIAKLKAP
jgi:hypothetical protein